MILWLKRVDHPNVVEAIEEAFKDTMNEIAESMNEYCKVDTGDTQGSMKWELEDNRRAYVEWNTPYAAYAYYRGRPSHNKNWQAQLRWAEYAHKKHGQQWTDDIRKRAAQLW